MPAPRTSTDVGTPYGEATPTDQPSQDVAAKEKLAERICADRPLPRVIAMTKQMLAAPSASSRMQAMTAARMLSIVEERYRDRYETMLDEAYPNLNAQDMRFLTYLGYIAANAGTLNAVSFDGDVFVPPLPDEENPSPSTRL